MSLRDKIEHAIQNQPCTVKDLKARFGGDRGADRKVMEALDALVHEAVVCQRSGVFFTVRSGRAEKALLCKVVKLGKNFAFVMLEDETSDIFIPGRFTRGAMPGDEVLVEKFEHPRVEGSDEGAILAVLTEKNDLVGTARRIEGRLKFVPDDCPAISMQLMRNCEGGAKDGDKVAVEILMRGSRQEDHRVGVAMRFGSSDEAKRCAKALLYAKDIRSRFPDKVREEAKKFEDMSISEADCEGRMDLRALPIFTIDSAETKDIDDAISLTRTPEGGFELGFSAQRALSRNRLIHAMGEKTLVAQCRAGTGGTWDGTTENLRHGWSPVFVNSDGSEGAQALIARGAVPVRTLSGLDDLQPTQLQF